MTNTKHILIKLPSGWGLREVPANKYGRADYWNTESEAEDQAAHEAYEKDLAACHPNDIPFPEGFTPPQHWVEGQEVPKGEYEVQFWQGTSWWPVKHLVDGKVKPGTKVRAIAMPVEREPVASKVEDGNYWKSRCLAAEEYIEKSPCDPDTYPDQIKTYEKWQSLKQQNP